MLPRRSPLQKDQDDSVGHSPIVFSSHWLSRSLTQKWWRLWKGLLCNCSQVIHFSLQCDSRFFTLHKLHLGYVRTGFISLRAKRKKRVCCHVFKMTNGDVRGKSFSHIKIQGVTARDNQRSRDAGVLIRSSYRCVICRMLHLIRDQKPCRERRVRAQVRQPESALCLCDEAALCQSDLFTAL